MIYSIDLERGGRLIQNEYYNTSENWPQPEDEANTLELEGYMGRTPVKKKNTSSKKQRRKLSESLAGVTAAAVAVVMVSAATPSLRGISSGLNDLIPSEICMICGDLDCPYWDTDGMEGLRITSDAVTTWHDLDPYAMNGFVYKNGNQSSGLWLQNGERVTLQVDPYDEMEGLQKNHMNIDVWELGWRTDRPAYTNWEFMNLEDESGTNIGHVVVQLVYYPDGVVPNKNYGLREVFLNEFGDDHYYFATSVDGIENVQLRVHTNADRFSNEEILDYCHVQVLKESNLTYTVGDTMTFTETEDVVRLWTDEVLSGYHRTLGFQYDSGEERKVMMFDVGHKHYYISGYWNETAIAFLEDSWYNIFDQWQELNDNAASKGHQICFAMKHAGETTVNGITYDLYLTYTTAPVDGYNHFPWLSHFYVPQQEPEIAIHFEESIEPEELAKLLTLTADEVINRTQREMLECFHLR